MMMETKARGRNAKKGKRRNTVRYHFSVCVCVYERESARRKIEYNQHTVPHANSKNLKYLNRFKMLTARIQFYLTFNLIRIYDHIDTLILNC